MDEAPRAPAAGTSTVTVFNEKLQMGILLFGDIIAVRATGVPSKYSLRILARARNSQEISDVFCGSRIGVFGPPMCIHMDEGGEWKS